MARSVKVNYILNLINTGGQMLFPLITFPYACRVIGVGGIGQVDFFSSIVSYISLFTCLGIPLYAIREIARDRDDVVRMNRTAVEILLLHTMLTVVGYVAVAVLCLTVPQIQADTGLFLVLSLTILFTAIGCEWFYQGIEDFLYVTIRGLIVKVVSVVLLFLMVKTRDDLILYGWYTVIGVLGGNLFNFFRLRKYIHRENIIFSHLNLRRHLAPVLKVFSFNVITSIFLQLNPVMLGFMKDALAVGYFTAATRVLTMILKLPAVLGSVMTPRMSNLVAENKQEEFRRYAQKSFDFTLAVCLPLSVGLVITAPCVIRVLCGEEFMPAVLCSQIIAPVVLMSGISNLFGMQVLYPIGKINIVILCCLIGAVTDLILGIVLIPGLSYEGTAIAYLGAETTITVSMYLIARKTIGINCLRRTHLPYYIGSVLMAVLLLLVPYLELSSISTLAVQLAIGVVSYALCLLAMKDELLYGLLRKRRRTP